MKDKRKTYHDYVIKDGKFIGEFEKMYQEHPDPWMQSEQPNQAARAAGIQFLKKYEVKDIVEAGCGLGYYSNWIFQETGIVPIAFDFSETAVKKATENFPELRFEHGDIVKDLTKYKSAGCIVFSEIIWYVLPNLTKILTALKSDFHGKLLLVNQVFYKGTQQYGNEYFTSLKEFLEYMPFEAIDCFEEENPSTTTIGTSTLFKIG